MLWLYPSGQHLRSVCCLIIITNGVIYIETKFVISPFGFQVNDWQDDWVSFYSQQRLQHQLGLVEQSYGDREARELWSKLQVNQTAQIFIPAKYQKDIGSHILINCVHYS